MLGFQMRYYKGHAFLCQSYFTLFLLIRSISCLFGFFSSQCHISYRIPGAQVSQSTIVLVFHPIFLWGGRSTDASLNK